MLPFKLLDFHLTIVYS